MPELEYNLEFNYGKNTVSNHWLTAMSLCISVYWWSMSWDDKTILFFWHFLGEWNENFHDIITLNDVGRGWGERLGSRELTPAHSVSGGQQAGWCMQSRARADTGCAHISVPRPFPGPGSQLLSHRRNVEVVLTQHMVPFCRSGPAVWKHSVFSNTLFIMFHCLPVEVWKEVCGGGTSTFSWFHLTFSHLRNKLFYYLTMEKEIAPHFGFTTSLKAWLLAIHWVWQGLGANSFPYVITQLQAMSTGQPHQLSPKADCACTTPRRMEACAIFKDFQGRGS